MRPTENAIPAIEAKAAETARMSPISIGPA
jgi:hypothetical protein